MESLLSWYQRKIGAYDLQIWERAVEIREQQYGGMNSMDKRSSSVKPDLIDIDLVRGSTFSKNKPQYSWLVVSCQAFMRVLLLPIFVKWWIQQTSRVITLLFICLYFLHGFVFFLYLGGKEEQFKYVSPAEVMMPPIIMLLLGSVHCHVVSTNFRPSSRNDVHRLKKKRTLSSALLEPVVSSSHQSTLLLITSSIKKQNDTTANCENIASDTSLNSAKSPMFIDSTIAEERKKEDTETLMKLNASAGAALMQDEQNKLIEKISQSIGKQRSSTTSNSCSNSDNDTADLLMHTDANIDSTSTDNNSSNGKSRRRRNILYEELNSTSSGSNSSSGNSDAESTSSNALEKAQEQNKKIGKMKHLSATVLLPCSSHGVDRISVKIWESNQCKKVQASILDIGSIIRRKVQFGYIPNDMFVIGTVFSVLIAIVPTLYRIAYHQSGMIYQNGSSTVYEKFYGLAGSIFELTHGRDASFIAVFVIHAVTVERFIFSFTFFVMLSAAFKTFRQRLLFAKYFSHLTSSRRAKKSDLPHFRLDKVENVRVWLSLRSYLRRRGPQRSVDVIVSSAFFLALFLLCFISLQLLHDSDLYFSSLVFWEITTWLLAVAIFLLNFMTVGAQINRKYRNTSILLTEQINLYLQMKQKPSKKEELQRANSVLAIAAKLIKEIEMPFNIYGLAMNPLLYNITRVVVLSAFSGVVSEILGFKLKIWKIKG